MQKKTVISKHNLEVEADKINFVKQVFGRDPTQTVVLSRRVLLLTTTPISQV